MIINVLQSAVVHTGTRTRQVEKITLNDDTVTIFSKNNLPSEKYLASWNADTNGQNVQYLQKEPQI